MRSSEELCRHELTVSTCQECAHREIVYVTDGGFAYHQHYDCEALAEGQELVSLRDGTPAEIRPISLGAATSRERTPCRTCYPAK